MKIAVIDDGICLNTAFYVKRLLFDMEYMDEKIQKRISPTLPDSHGTIVGDIIQSYEETVCIGSVKTVWHETGGSPQALAAAIMWCADYGVDVIHMSLGTMEWQDFIVIDHAVRTVSPQISLIAAGENFGQFSAPASLPSVWSVSSLRLKKRLHVMKKETGAYDICADLKIPNKLRQKYGLHMGWSNSYQAAAVTGCLARENLFSGASDNTKRLQSVLKQYTEKRNADDIFPRRISSCEEDEKEIFQIPVVWVRYENGRKYVSRDVVSFLNFFHNLGYYAVSLQDIQPDDSVRRSFFENYCIKIRKEDIEKLLTCYLCDILIVFSEKEPLDGADSLLAASEQRLEFYDLQEKTLLSVQQIRPNENWAYPAGNMILAGYLGEIHKQGEESST